MNFFRLFTLALLLHCSALVYSQCAYPLEPTLQSEIPFSFADQAMTVRHDIMDRPYIYVAGKEKGLRIYDVSDETNPASVQEIEIDQLDNLEVMSITQEGNYLYLALGTFFQDIQNPGMAIVDVTDPTTAFLVDLYKYPDPTGGAGMVKLEGNYAYLAAMQHGLIVLDVSNKSNITFVSQFVPSINYPNPTNPDPAKYNARGMEVKNDLVYLCYDAGGFRIINVQDKQNPKETGRHSLPEIDNLPRAYNNVILDGDLVYIAIDYCGMEVLDISDTANISQVSWWNPWDCASSPLNWFSSPGHTNEIEMNKECGMVFLSAGKSEVLMVDVSNPQQPVLCDSFGSVNSSQGTWGLGLYKDRIYAGYIFVPLGVPFFSNWGGVKIIEWKDACATGIEVLEGTKIQAYPNPANPANHTFKLTGLNYVGNYSLEVLDISGRIVARPVLAENFEIDVGSLEPAIYFLRIYDGKSIETIQIVKTIN